MRFRVATAGVAALVLLAATDDDGDGVVCTEEFRTAVVTLVDAAGAAVLGADVRTYLVRTGERVPVTSIIDLIPGSYLILDDNAVALIQGEDEAFRVTADGGAAGAAEATYRFAAPNGCHIEKVSGPDTLTVR